MWQLGKLRVLSGREVCAIVAENGFVQVRQRGSHVVMQKRSEHGTTPAPVSQPGRIGRRKPGQPSRNRRAVVETAEPAELIRASVRKSTVIRFDVAAQEVHASSATFRSGSRQLSSISSVLGGPPKSSCCSINSLASSRRSKKHCSAAFT